jgi:hypothetical protein
MKIKDGFISRKVGDSYVVVAIGERATQFNGIITLNESGKFLFDCLLKGCTMEQLVDSFYKEFSIGATRERAQADVENYIEALRGAKVVED